MLLSDGVSALKSVGRAKAALLQKLGIQTIGDLVEFFPRDYLDRSRIYEIGELEEGQMATIRAAMRGHPQTLRKGPRTITKIVFGDGTGHVELVWFNQPYIGGNFKIDGEYLISGRVKADFGKLTIDNPDCENVPRGTQGAGLSGGRIVPVYALTSGISQKILRGLISQALGAVADELKDFLPQGLKEAYGLCDRGAAIQSIHFPESGEAYFAARRRLVFEELLLMQGAMMWVKGYTAQARGRVFENLELAQILEVLPYELTGCQQNVIGELCRDMASGFAANRLIQGDVGSGKTAVAMVMCFLAKQNGVQAALMAPTETLAQQHYMSLKEIFDRLGVRCALLTGSVKPEEKRRIKERLKAGEVDIAIGTHALIQEGVEFFDLGLVVTDEQHRFGVRQRAALNAKGEQAHVLVMTATPIPRSLAMVLYGDMDISVIGQRPPGRQKIDTYCVDRSYHSRIFKFVRDEVKKGNQGYVICPLVDESESEDFEDINSAIKFAEQLRGTVLADVPLGVLHGRMKPEEKSRIMADFAAGEIKVLVATTVIEVGIDVPDATVIVIENAERFGLSQLHQLRGRVGRSEKKSYCILVTDAGNAVTKKRMEAMTRTNDGFELSELDLQLRGPGEFFGTMQHGIPQMRLANLYRDVAVLEETKDAIGRIFKADEELCLEEHRGLREKIMGVLGNIQKISL